MASASSNSEFWHRSLLDLPEISTTFIKEFSKKSLPILETLSRGYKFFHEDYIHDVEVKLSKGDTAIMVRSKCYRSMKKNEEPHKLSVVFRRTQTTTIIDRNQCSCAAGQALCHHVLGLLFTLAHYQMLGLKSVPPLISKTSKPQTWHIPSRLEGINPRAVTKLVIQKSKPKQTGEPYKKKRKVSGVRSTVYKPFEQPLQDIDLPGILAQTFSEIEPNPGFLRIWPDKEEEQVLVQSAYGEVPKGCVISYQQPLNAKKEPSIQLPGFEFPKLSYCHTVLGEREHLFFSALTVTHNQSVEFEVETREQSMTNAWHSLRKFRLTASNFKNICSRRKDFDTLSKRLLKGKFIQTAAMKYGIQNEDVAAKLYTKQFARETHKVGFLINPSVPHLGCSPDRRVHDNSEAQPWGLLEIKCSPADKLENLNYLRISGGAYSLKKVHAYYYQVMGCLGLTGCQWSDFYVYCRQEFHYERIYFDESVFSEMLDKLNLFYFGYHLSSCIESSFFENWPLLERKAGIVTSHPSGFKRSCMVKPLSAMISSPASSKSNRPDCLTSSLSDMLPSKRQLT